MLTFSIIIPVYKVEKYIHKCIDSVLKQSYQNYEIILVDDGSPDNCPKICDEYKEKYEQIKVVHKQNGGAASARNAGISVASGEYVLFIDSDDYWECDDALLKIKEQFEITNAEVLIFGRKRYYQLDNVFEEIKISKIDESLSQEKYIEELMQNNYFIACAPDKACKRSFLEKKNLSFVTGQCGEDVEWCIKLLLASPKITILDKYVYVYIKQNSGSVTANIGAKNLKDIANVIKKYTEIALQNDNKLLLNFIACQYVIWLKLSSKCKDKELKNDIKEMKKFWFLVNYDKYSKVKKLKTFKFFGFNFTRALLKLLG